MSPTAQPVDHQKWTEDLNTPAAETAPKAQQEAPVPPKAEKSTSKEKTGDSADLRDFVAIVIASNPEIRDAVTWIEESYKGITAADAMRDGKDPRIQIVANIESMVRCIGTNFSNEAIRKKQDQGDTLTESSTLVYRDQMTHGKKAKGKLDGYAAEQAFTARMRGYQKVFLYASGFNITIRPPTIEELNRFTNSVDLDGKEIGTMLGGHYFYILDHFIKAKFMEFLPMLVVDSNLKGWDKGRNLASAISIHDYETVLWAVCRTMYTRGVTINHLCSQKTCVHLRSVKYDLAKLRVVNTSIVSEEAFGICVGADPVTIEDCDNYRNKILRGGGSFVVEEHTFHTRVPSTQEVINYSEKIIERLVANTQGERSLTSTKVNAQLSILFANSFAPWIKSVTHSSDDAPEIYTEDSNAIYRIIAMFQDSDEFETLKTKILSLPQDTRPTFIGFVNEPCEKCNHKDEVAGGFKAWDPGQLFFTLSSIKIGRSNV